jgi:L-fuconolactonase
MQIIDAQLHAAEDHPGHPPVETLLAMMAEVGVGAAVLAQLSTQGSDNSYLLDSAARFPGKFGVVGCLDPSALDLDDQLRRWPEQPGAIGVRIVIRSPEEQQQLREGLYTAQLRAAEQAGVPVFLFCPGLLPVAGAIARAHPDLLLVIDHLGLAGSPPPPRPFAALPQLLTLAACENIAVKCTAAPALSAERYPFADLWPRLHAVLGSFGPERVMWGTDITRVDGMHSYREAVDYVRETDQLSASEKELVMGKSLQLLLRWPPPGAPAGS